MKAFNFLKKGFLFFASVLLLMGFIIQKSSKPQTHIVEIRDMRFQPENLNVHKGDTIVWINRDIVAHDVTEENKAWASPSLAMNASWKKAITKNASYFCSIHVVMKGKLSVEE